MELILRVATNKLFHMEKETTSIILEEVYPSLKTDKEQNMIQKVLLYAAILIVAGYIAACGT